MKEPLLPLDPMLMLQPTPGTVTMGMVDTGEDTEVTTDHTDIMATMARDLPIKMPLNLDPTPMLIRQPTPGMVTMGMGTTGLTVMVTMGTGHMGMPTGDKKWTSRTTSDLSLPTHL